VTIQPPIPSAAPEAHATRVMVVDDHPMWRDAVERDLLGQSADRGERERGGRRGVQRHARAGAGQRLGGVEAARGDRRAGALGSTDQRCAMPARAAIRSNTRAGRSGRRSRAQSTKAVWMSCVGVAVPIA